MYWIFLLKPPLYAQILGAIAKGEGFQTLRRMSSCVSLSCGLCDIYPYFHTKCGYFRWRFFFVNVGIGHRNMKDLKRGQVLTRAGPFVPKWEFFTIIKFKKNLRDVHVCEASDTSKLCVVNFSLHHPYLPILGTNAKLTMVPDHLRTTLDGPRDIYPLVPRR
jgi:hypothetical protein